jgi:hypothetical protein
MISFRRHVHTFILYDLIGLKMCYDCCKIEDIGYRNMEYAL